MYQLIRSVPFDRALAKFLRRHPDLRRRIGTVLRDLEADPSQAHLHIHALAGGLRGAHAVTLTRAYRIVLTLDTSRREITLLDIGSHDEVYR